MIEATVKESCTVWDENDNETYCFFRLIDYRGEDWGCDWICQPFGGIWNPTGGFDGYGACEWGDDMERCPEDWTRMGKSWNGQELVDTMICDTKCLGTGGHVVLAADEFGEYEECQWPNISSTELFPDGQCGDYIY